VPAAEVVMLDAAEAAAHVLDVAAGAGASYVITVCHESRPPPPAGLAALCDLAADRGLAISLEFMPFSGVPTIADAVRLVEAADRENLGFVLDTWHWTRQPGGPDLATLRSIPPERIHLFQLNDTAAVPGEDLRLETLDRLLPGEGTADIRGLAAVLDEIGATPVVVSEVFSTSLAALEPAENARRQHAAATSLLP
jgi:sugar phosphate isomerase/epimerase